MATINVIYEVEEELRRARAEYPRPFASAHEGFSLLKEEVDELWGGVRLKQNHPNDPGDKERNRYMRKEAIQVAAMALRFVLDVCDRDEATS